MDEDELFDENEDNEVDEPETQQQKVKVMVSKGQNPTEHKTEEPEAPEPKKSESSSANGCVKIICDPADLDAGFVAPWSIVIKLDENITKKDLIEAVVNELDHVRAMFPNDKSKEQAYRRWVCKTLNIADAAFSSPEAMETEMNAAADSLNVVKKSKPSVDLKDPKEILAADKASGSKATDDVDNENEVGDDDFSGTGFFI